MIELNFTLVIQLAIVLFLMVILSKVVFGPFLAFLQQRKDRVEASEIKARELQQRTEELMERYQDTISSAQAQGTAIREQIRKEGLAKEMEILQKAMEEANRFIGDMKGKLQEETEIARAKFRVQAQSLSREIAEKILGRPIS